MVRPMDQNRPIEPHRVSKRPASSALILSAVSALAILTAIFVVYSYKVGEKIDNTVATERAAPPAATTGSGERPPTTSNVPPATAPSPQR